MRVFFGICTLLLVATVSMADVVEHFACDNQEGKVDPKLG